MIRVSLAPASSRSRRSSGAPSRSARWASSPPERRTCTSPLRIVSTTRTSPSASGSSCSRTRWVPLPAETRRVTSGKTWLVTGELGVGRVSVAGPVGARDGLRPHGRRDAGDRSRGGRCGRRGRRLGGLRLRLPGGGRGRRRTGASGLGGRSRWPVRSTWPRWRRGRRWSAVPGRGRSRVGRGRLPAAGGSAVGGRPVVTLGRSPAVVGGRRRRPGWRSRSSAVAAGAAAAAHVVRAATGSTGSTARKPATCGGIGCAGATIGG